MSLLLNIQVTCDQEAVSSTANCVLCSAYVRAYTERKIKESSDSLQVRSFFLLNWDYALIAIPYHVR